MPSNLTLYELHSRTIDQELAKKRHKWTLTAIPSVSYDDVEQIIRTHIYIKIHLYDPAKSSIECWLNAVISNQMRNLIRNLYSSISSPCSRCSASEGDNGCRIYGAKDMTCPLLRAWTENKKQAYDIKLALPMENHTQEVYDIPHVSLDIEKASHSLHERMLWNLKPMEARVYKFLYIEHLPEDEVTSRMNFKKPSNGSPCKQLTEIKKTILNLAREILYQGEVDFE